MSKKTERLMKGVVDVGEGKMGNDSERKSRALELVSRLSESLLDHSVVLADMNEHMILYRDAWNRIQTQFGGSICLECGAHVKAGEFVWIHEIDSTKVLCNTCGMESDKQLRVIDQRRLFRVIDERGEE